MIENSGNKNITAYEKRKKSFFYAVAEGEGNIGKLSDALNVSRVTVRRYARELENAGLVRFMMPNVKDRKKIARVGISHNLCFAILKIEAKTIELFVYSLPQKYEYSVTLAYNEALNDTDNALCAKRTLERLCEQAFAYRTFVGVILADGSCLNASICGEIFCDTVLSVSECESMARKNKTERTFSLTEGFCEPPRVIRSNNRDAYPQKTVELWPIGMIDALVLKAIRNSHSKTSENDHF